MQKYVRALCDGEPAARLVRLLDRVTESPALHARFLNTLARLEYVGVRKMLKSRRAERLDLDGLEHLLDEAVHALRLKKAALAVAAAAPEDVRTFSDVHTLAGDAGERYFQALDRRAEEILLDLPEEGRPEANYLLTSAAIEVRAQAFYPLYERALKARGTSISIASILKDEARHLAEMGAALERALPDWRRRLEAVLDREAALFAGFLAAVEAALDAATSASAHA
jgi:hypothetical protein